MKQAQAGFTLIEVLVALAITAIALLAGLQGSDAMTRLAARQLQQWQAQLCAHNALTALRLQAQWPSIGESTQNCVQAGREYTVRLIVTATPNPSFRAAQVRVFAAGETEYSLLQLATILGRY